MKPRDLLDLLLLAALWGGSFLFMRVAAPEFGPVALALVRVAVAAAFLVAVLAWLGRLDGLRARWAPLAIVGTINSALPFVLFAYATLSVTAGFAAILNATTPMWGALVAWAWLREPLGAARAAGLAVGFAGVLLLVGSRAGTAPGGDAADGSAGLPCRRCPGATNHPAFLPCGASSSCSAPSTATWGIPTPTMTTSHPCSGEATCC